MPVTPTPPTEWQPLQDFMEEGSFLSKLPDGSFINVPLISMAAPTIHAVLCGLDFAPGSASALDRWRTAKRLGELASGVALFDWPGPGPGEGDRSSIVQFTATLGVAAVSIAVSTITDAALLAAGPRSHVLKMRVVNNSLPQLPVTLAAAGAGRIPLRYLPGVANLDLPHSEEVEYEIETDGNTIGYVRSARLLGKTSPPVWALVDDARASGAPVTQLGAGVFAPFMYEGEAMLLFMLRTTGTGVTLPTGRGWGFPADADLVNGGTYNGTTSGLRVAVSTSRGADGVVDGTNTLSNQQYLGVLAFRGTHPTDFKEATTTGATVAFPAFSGLAPGDFVL